MNIDISFFMYEKLRFSYIKKVNPKENTYVRYQFHFPVPL
jgi:hypothetical protein